ncbi:2915_t:CDS:2, partial [Acaulospora morrowiae]
MFNYFRRSLDVVKEQGMKIARANPTHWDKEKPLLTLNSREDLKEWVLGCDKDIGGYSNANLEITPEGVGRFSGSISLELPKKNPIIEKSGYAAIKSMNRRSLFGPTDGPIPTDLYQHRLFLRKPGEWETVMGIIQDPQVIMYREKVRTIGFSLLSQPGPFCLEIDWIKMMNTEHTV